MQSVPTFLGPQSVEQELPLLGHSHPAELDRTSGRNAHRFTLKLGCYMRAQTAVFAVAAIMWLIALAWRCLFSRSRGSSSGHRWRRLASGGGKQGEGNGEENPQACESLEEILPGLEGEDAASNPPPPQPTGVSVGAAPDEEQPQKRKQKTKRPADDSDETSEEQAKRARLEEWVTDDELQELESLLFSFEDPNSTSSPAPPFSPHSAKPGDEDTLETRIITGMTTLVDWLLDPEDDVPLTNEEQRRPEGSADSSPLEGTSRDFPHYPPFQAMESRGPQEPKEDTEMPSTSSAVSGIQRLSSQPSLPQRVEAPEPSSLLEASAAPSGEVPLIPFNPHIGERYVRYGGLVRKLEPLERLLRKENLSSSDKQAIISYSKTLYLFAKAQLWQLPVGQLAYKLLPTAVNRVLVMEILWRACERVGSAMNKQEWWQQFVSALYGNETWWTPPQRSSYVASLLGKAHEAMKCFIQGRHPGKEEWAQLLRAFFNKKAGLQGLSGTDWDLWRKEDEDF